MRLGALLAILWLALAGPAAAQTVSVRSGEHPGFSRIVFETQEAEGWALGRGPDGYLLRFDDPALEFDLSRVFAMIPRQRLTDIRLEAPGLLTLDIAGAVHAAPFVLRPGVLVVDIKDGPAPSGSPFETPLSPGMAAATEGAADAETPPPDVASDGTPPADRQDDSLPAPPVRLPIGLGRLSPDPVVGPFLPKEAPAQEDPRVIEARTALMQEIARAAAQGLLEPAETLPQATESADTAPATDPSAGEEPSEAGDALAALGQRRNIRIETSIDQGLDLPGAEQDLSAEGDPCLPDSAFDLDAWLDGRPPAELIAERRSDLLNMRDTVDPQGALALAQSYLSLGFGAEAGQVLDLLDTSEGLVPVWRAMGGIVDSGRSAHPEIFDGQLSCPSRAALWAALSRPNLPDVARIDRAAVVRSFSELPPHVRSHLGPMLAERFLARGDEVTARRIRNTVARAGAATRTGDLTLVEARLELAQGDTDLAGERISEILSEGGPASPEALALRIETELDSGHAPEADDVGLAEALAFERRGTPLGARLMALSIRGHAARGEFQTAFIQLVHNGLQGQRAIASELLAALAQNGSDADVVRESFAGILTDPGLDATAEARLDMAARLTALGFADRGEQILVDLQPRGTEQERLVRAEIAMTRGQPQQALQYLAGLDGEAADLIRAHAAEAAGDLATAERYFGALGETGRQGALAWKSRDWAAINASGTPEQSAYARARAAEPDPAAADPGAAPSLAGARAALEQSAAMREKLNGLLALPPASP